MDSHWIRFPNKFQYSYKLDFIEIILNRYYWRSTGVWKQWKNYKCNYYWVIQKSLNIFLISPMNEFLLYVTWNVANHRKKNRSRSRGMAHEHVQADFTRKFRKPGPSRQVIRDLENKFKRTGSVVDDRHSGRLATTPKTMQIIQDSPGWVSEKKYSKRHCCFPARHFTRFFTKNLNKTFTDRWICRGSPRLWMARSPDLPSLDFSV